MCLYIYVGTGQPLQEIEWDEENPAFYVERLGEDEESVRPHFSKPHVYYVGSDGGCGCGFQPEDWPEGSTDPDMLSNRENRRKLIEFIESVVQQGPIELFAVWAGEQSAEPQERLEVTPAHFAGRWREFDESQFFVVRSDGP